MKALKFTIIGLLLLVSAGCQNKVDKSLWDQINTLENEKQQLSQQADALERQNSELEGQVTSLSGFDRAEREKALPIIKHITLINRTGFVDKNNDGKKEKLAVYIKPYDMNGDVIKSAASVDVQLWDLEKTPDEALVGKWHISPEELGRMWIGEFMTGYYRILLEPDPSVLEEGKDYTIKAVFTEYISGKVFSEQVVRRP